MAEIKISVDRIQEGNYVKLPVTWGSHPFLFTNFKIKSQEQIDVIRKLGLKHVTIVPEKSDVPPLPPVNEDTTPTPNINDDKLSEFEKHLWEDKQKRIEQLKEYRRNLQQCEKKFQHSLSQVKGLMSKISSRPLNAIEEAKELIDAMADSLLSADTPVLHLMGENKETESLYFHSLNVAVLGMLLGKLSGFNEQEIKAIGLGGLFHDIGKLKLPSQLLRKTEALTPAELNFFKLHTKYGRELLELAKNFPEVAKKIVYQHHELIDGSGYPEGLCPVHEYTN